MKASEIPRRLTRTLLPRVLYIRMAELLNYTWAIRAIGIEGYRRLVARGGPTLRSFALRGYAHEFWLRPGTSDVNEFIGNVIRQTYGQYFPKGRISSILDAGANIGDTTVWYLNRFPDATVVAIEPHPGNFELLRRNCEPYGNRAKLVWGAVWSTSGEVTLKENLSCVKHRVERTAGSGGIRCPAFSVGDLLRQFRLEHIDILKCDIEGAEVQVFKNADPWLFKTRSIVIELHNEESRIRINDIAKKRGWLRRQYRNVYYYA